MVDSLNGKERKELAKWIFFAIAAHPEIRSYTSISSEDINTSDKVVGELISRLLIVDCPDELKIANSSDPLAIQDSFGLVGQVAIQELMTNQGVMKSIAGYINYLDKEKINVLLVE